MPLTLAQKLKEMDRITLLQPSGTLDSEGKPDAPVVYKTKVYAGIEQLPQQDQQSQGRENFTTTLRTRITIRYDANVRSNWFATNGGKTYTIEQVVDPGIPDRNVFLELWCKLIDDGSSTPT